MPINIRLYKSILLKYKLIGDKMKLVLKNKYYEVYKEYIKSNDKKIKILIVKPVQNKKDKKIHPVYYGYMVVDMQPVWLKCYILQELFL